jgi:hypothetical protein
MRQGGVAGARLAITAWASAMPRANRTRRWLAAVAVAVGLWAPVPPNPRMASGQPPPPEGVRLVETFVDALNRRDGNLLASLYAYSPHSLCSDLDILVFNEVTKQEPLEPLVLKELTKSQASLSGAPGTAALRTGGFIVDFGLTWTYRLKDDANERTLHVRVQWRIEKQGGTYTIMTQKTTDLDHDSAC